MEWGTANGVVVDDLEPQQIQLVGFAQWTPASDDLVLLCIKCYDNAVVLERIAPTVELIPIQNGYDAQLRDRIHVEGIASFVTECIPGKTHTRITRPGDLHIGFSGAANDRVLPSHIESMIDVLRRNGRFTVRRVPEVLPYKNTKLMYNAAISPIAAMAGLDNGELLTHSTARRLFFALIREHYQILKAALEPLEKVGPFHPDTVNWLLRLPLVPRLLALPFSRTLRGTYCSMAGEIETGRTELDNYNGYLLELAGDLDVPVNRAVYTLAKKMEQDRSTPSLSTLDELISAIDGTP
jgi:2-dehydropantoate 2-reductase